MKFKTGALLLGMMLYVFGSVATFAQNRDDDANSKSKTRTISGCLTKGDEANSKEYLLTGEDGSTWEVRSDTVSLSEYTGQTVSATGVVRANTAHNLKEDAKGAAADAHVNKNKGEHGHMTITDLQKVSGSCNR